MSNCNDCPTLDECGERRACQRRHGAITVSESNDMAQAMNAYNARVHAATDDLLIRAARFAGSIVGAVVLGLYTIGRVWGGS